MQAGGEGGGSGEEEGEEEGGATIESRDRYTE